MPADASIYNMIRPQAVVPLEHPDDIQAKRLTLANLMRQGQLGDLNMQQTRRGIADDERISALFAAGTPTERDIMAINPKRGMEYGKALSDRQNTEATRKKAEAETLAKNVSILRDQLATVTDQAGHDQWREMNARLLGPDMAAKIDPVFSPKKKLDGLQTADKLLEKLKPIYSVQDFGGTKGVVQSNPLAEGGVTGIQPKTQTPGEVASNAVARGNLAETRANNAKPVFDPVRGVFATRPDAKGASAVITPAGMPQSPQQIQSLREDTDKLRQEFEAKPAVKQFRDVLPIAASAKQAPDTRAGDIQMAYAVGKILDPNSVVREGELKLVGNAATVMQQVEGELRTLTKGKGRLTPQTRVQLNEMLENAVANRKASFEAEKGSYGGIVQRRGYKPEDVFIDVPQDRRAPAAPAAVAPGWKVTPVK